MSDIDDPMCADGTGYTVADALRAIADLIDTDPTFALLAERNGTLNSPYEPDSLGTRTPLVHLMPPYDRDARTVLTLAAQAAHAAGHVVENDDRKPGSKYTGIEIRIGTVWLNVFCDRDALITKDDE